MADPTPAEQVEEAPKAPEAPPLFPDGLPVELQELPQGLASLSAQSCNGCHYAVHDDWSASAHAGASAEEPFRSALQASGDSPLFASCHLPLANQQAHLVKRYAGGPLSSAELVDNPSWDATLAAEGVTCASCHVREGTVVGTRAAPNAPHPVAVSEELGTSEFCASCHQLSWEGAEQPLYDTWGEWAASGYQAAGVRCQDCHMPPTSGMVTASRFAGHANHGWVADPSRALTVLVDLPPSGLVRGEPTPVTLTLMNTGAGHAFPTGSPFSWVRVELAVQVEGEDPAPALWSTELRRQIAEEPPYTMSGDSRLPAGGTAVHELELLLDQKSPAGNGALEVRFVRVTADHEELLFSRELPARIY